MVEEASGPQGLRASELFGHSQVEIDISQGFVDVSARSQT